MQPRCYANSQRAARSGLPPRSGGERLRLGLAVPTGMAVIVMVASLLAACTIAGCRSTPAPYPTDAPMPPVESGPSVTPALSPPSPTPAATVTPVSPTVAPTATPTRKPTSTLVLTFTPVPRAVAPTDTPVAPTPESTDTPAPPATEPTDTPVLPTPESSPTPVQSGGAPSGLDVPPGKALFVFYNYTHIDWNLDIGPYFLQVPATQSGQEHAAATIAIDPGTYTWQATSPGGEWFIKMGHGGAAAEFTVAAGDVYVESVR